MTKPIILTVDDEAQVLNAIARDLQAHYRGEYRIVKASSGSEAMETVQQLKRRNAPLALFLVDQRMPVMTGIEFLRKAVELYPQARKVLLTAYADTDAAIASINALGLDYYLMKPWDPPEQRLYPVLDDLLSDWYATAPVPYDGIRLAGTRWSASSHRVKEFLARNQLPYQWLDIEKDSEARAMVQTASPGGSRVPVLFFPDGSTLVDPDLRSLADKVGLSTHAKQPFYDLIVLGAGPAGLAAAVYGASEGLRTLVIEKGAAGGQAGSSARIENYLGFPQGISGSDLTRRATTQALRFGAEILTAQEVTQVRTEDPYRWVKLGDGTEISCHALLLTTGVKVRPLEVPGVDALDGSSVYYGAATTEAVHFRGGRVFVIGGANSAGQGAVFLSRYASKVTMVIRGQSLSANMSRYLVDQIERTQNIEVLTSTVLTAVTGDGHLETITLTNTGTGSSESRAADAIFVFIGAIPYSDLVTDLVERDESGFILTGPDLIRDGQRPRNWRLRRDPFLLETSVPGIFAAGDVRHGVVRRVASAVGQGAVAVSLIHKYLETV